jgi:uncharacterized protein YukE
VKNIQNSVDAVLSRLDRIIERLEDIGASTKAARKQSEITGEQTERMCRAVGQLENTINEYAAKRRQTDTQPLGA